MIVVMRSLSACHPGASHEQGNKMGKVSASEPYDSTQSSAMVYEGDVWVRLRPDTAFHRLTHVGLVRETALSADSRSVAYVRDTPGDPGEGGAGPASGAHHRRLRRVGAAGT